MVRLSSISLAVSGSPASAKVIAAIILSHQLGCFVEVFIIDSSCKMIFRSIHIASTFLFAEHVPDQKHSYI